MDKDKDTVIVCVDRQSHWICRQRQAVYTYNHCVIVSIDKVIVSMNTKSFSTKWFKVVVSMDKDKDTVIVCVVIVSVDKVIVSMNRRQDLLPLSYLSMNSCLCNCISCLVRKCLIFLSTLACVLSFYEETKARDTRETKAETKATARPYESCKILKGRPRWNAFSKLVHRQYKSFPSDRFCQVEIQNTTGLSNKLSTAQSCAEDQILENKNIRNMILDICTQQ